jgi:hypothetical protein
MGSAQEPRLELYWIPLGAGERVVRASGFLYERLVAAIARRPPCRLFHSALIAHLSGPPVCIEMAPTPDDRGRQVRGVVAEGPVGLRRLGRLRVFRYEVRCWEDGAIPDLPHAVASPVLLSSDGAEVRAVLAALALVPTPVWGRDELGAGEMWNSNSVVSWVLTTVGLLEPAGAPPHGGRAPGWDAGVVVAHRAHVAATVRE